jgi:hypothetical protein
MAVHRQGCWAIASTDTKIELYERRSNWGAIAPAEQI